MTILVTGANGFIGSHIVRSLLKRGYPVRVFVRDGPRTDLRNLDGLEVELARGDLLKPASVVDAAKGCKAIFHAAGLISTHPFHRQRVWEVNFLGASNVLAAARQAGVERVVYTASIFTLGVGVDGRPADENVCDNLDGLRIPYVLACRAAYAKVSQYLASGMSIVLVYPTYCIGPGIHNPQGPPYRQIIAFLRGWMPVYIPGGMNVVDVRDVAEAHVLAFERGSAGQKYLVGGENITFHELFRRLNAAANRRSLLLPAPNAAALAGGWVMQWFSRAPLMDAAAARLMRYRWYYDSSKAARELGYTARPLDETLRDTVAWLRKNRYIR